jgi:hypothetical protein
MEIILCINGNAFTTYPSLKSHPLIIRNPLLEFLKPHGARCGVEKGTQMGGLIGGEGEILYYWCKFSQ